MKKLTAPPVTAEWVERVSHLGGGVEVYYTDQCPTEVVEHAFRMDEQACEQHRICVKCSAGVSWHFLEVLRANRFAAASVDVFDATARAVGAADVDEFVEDFGALFAVILDSIEEVANA
jgi:hypothetical protein